MWMHWTESLGQTWRDLMFVSKIWFQLCSTLIHMSLKVKLQMWCREVVRYADAHTMNAYILQQNFHHMPHAQSEPHDTQSLTATWSCLCGCLLSATVTPKIGSWHPSLGVVARHHRVKWWVTVRIALLPIRPRSLGMGDMINTYKIMSGIC